MLLEFKQWIEQLHKSRNKGMMKFLLIFFCGQFLFLTSKSWFPNGNDYQMATPMYTEKSAENVTFTLTKWEYSPAERMMELDIGIANNSLDKLEDFEYEAMTRELKKLDIEVIASEEDFAIVRVGNVPKKWKEMIFNIYVKSSDGKKKQVKFYTNDESVKVKKSISLCTEEQYFKKHMELLISEQNKKIQTYQKENQDKTKKQEEYAEKILELTESKEFQTEKEQENTDNIIKKAYGNIRNLEEEKKTNIQNVEECNKKIEVLKKKLSKKPGKEEKK